MVSMAVVLDRIGVYLKTKSDAEIGRALGKNENPSQYVNNWRRRGTIPWEELFNFSQREGVSFDWLLTGEKENDFMCKWDEKSREACRKLKEIIDSDDKFAVPAILSNIDAFRDSVDKTDRLKKIEAAVTELKKSNADLSSEQPKKTFSKKKTM